MKTKCIGLLRLALLTGATIAINAGAVSPEFTYQGRLDHGTNAAGGLYDFRLALFDTADSGTLIGERIDLAAVPVTNGLFTLDLDFGLAAFDGTPRWLQIAVRTNGGSGFTTLHPRQALTATPHATFAAVAGTATLATTVATGAITTSNLADGAVTTSKIAPGAVTPAQMDDGGAAEYEALLESAGFLSPAKALPFSTLSLVTSNSGAAPTLTFTLQGAALGTVVSFMGHEALSEPYQFVVEISLPEASLDANAQLGKQGRLMLGRNGRSTSFAGLVTGCTRAAAAGTNSLYAFRLESPLAYLALSTDCRVYQDKTVLEVVKPLYLTVSATPLSESIELTYPKRDAVIQYAESGLNFFSRLLEDEGIFYFFQSGAGSPTLVIADNFNHYLPAPYSPFHYYGNSATNRPIAGEYLRTFQKSVRESTRTATVSSYNFRSPLQNLQGTVPNPEGQGEQYGFGSFRTTKAANDAAARARAERSMVERATLFGTGTAPDLRPGYFFTLTDDTGAGLGGSYVVTATRHAAFRRDTNGGASLYYGNQIEVLPTTMPYRPALKTPKPVAQASTAVVTGPAGEEIYADEYGRVRVQFHWDRYGAQDENSSAWLRVTTPWAGKQWGMFFIPRIGQEVLVDFIQGDPDRPIIVGSLFNGANLPPYALPANKTRSGIKTDSSIDGLAENANEIRFEDKKGAEQLYLHAGKDLDLVVNYDMTAQVDHDLTSRVGNDLSLTVGHDLRISAEHNLTLAATNDLVLSSGRGVGINTPTDPAIALKVGGTVAAGLFQGSGAGLTSLSANALTGTLPDARLSSNVPRLNTAQSFSGAASFFAPVGVGGAAGPDALTINGITRLNNYNLLLRDGADMNHGLGWYGAGKLFGGVNVDGPVLYGCDGGGLGTACSSPLLALRWRGNGNVTIDPHNLNPGALLPGLTFGDGSGEGISSRRVAGGNGFGLDLYTSNQVRVAISQSGNVGIGRVTPAVALDVVGAVRATGALRSGSETGTAHPPSYPSGSDGLVIRRARSIAMTAGSIVARTDKLTLERDGSSAGLRLTYPALAGRQIINCIGMSTNGAQVIYRNVLTNSPTGGSLTLFTDAQKIVHYDISFGDTYSSTPGHLTHAVLDRYDDGLISDNYLVGTLTSTYNQ